MNASTKLGAVLLGALVVGLGAACGGASTSRSTSGGGAAASSSGPNAAKAQVTQAWERFFSGKTTAQQKIALLQNGQRFAPALRAQAKSPLAKRSSATVKSVKLEGPSKAKVVYTISLAGTPALKNQTGVAVKSGGRWKVGDASFCSLLSLQGAAPSLCKSG